MDDFDDGKADGYTMFVRETDGIEQLGGIKEYFIPLNPTEKWKAVVVNQMDRSVGFLPMVRAC